MEQHGIIGYIFHKKKVINIKYLEILHCCLPGLVGSPEKFTLHRGSPESSVVAVGIHLDSAVGIFRIDISLGLT